MESATANHLSVYDIAIHTPLIESLPLSKCTPKFNVLLKLENTQPSGSFKQRGLGLRSLKAKADGFTHLVSSSGGNAGLAIARSARVLGLPSTVVVPMTTSQHSIELLKEQGAIVIRHGSSWVFAHDYALTLVDKITDANACYIHPFDDPIVWEVHASMIYEISEQLKSGPPAAIVVSCGGGGLLLGVLEAIDKLKWDDTQIFVVETEGAASFNLMTKSGGKPARLEKITSLAITLGALEVAPKLVDDYFSGKYQMTSLLVTDKEAIDATVSILNDHRVLVELSCSASLAAIYNGSINKLLESKNIVSGDIVCILCGGAGVSETLLQQWKTSSA